ncbi:hypothetical protein [Methylobacterium haplocladii]|nr:hypothetical protein [Methylobacterium haplocladii]GJD85327.1 hypothetical protein HPGCJGGD_3215 [Methylobacterium haplocladii]
MDSASGMYGALHSLRDTAEDRFVVKERFLFYDRSAMDPTRACGSPGIRHQAESQAAVTTLDGMDGPEFKHRLRVMGRTQAGFASEIGVVERTVHYWASRGPPAEIVYLLDVLADLEMPFGPMSDIADDASATEGFKRTAVKVVERLAYLAALRGAEQEFIETLRLWLDERTDRSRGDI